MIGKKNKIREYVTINPGTAHGGGLTTIGDNCLFMISSHVAHDCKIGNNVILANNVALAGHVEIDDNVIIGGNSAVQQFTRIGKFAMIGGMTGVEKDVIPFGLATGNRSHLEGINIIGLKRAGYSNDEINALNDAVKLIFSNDILNSNNKKESYINITLALDKQFFHSETTHQFVKNLNHISEFDYGYGLRLNEDFDFNSERKYKKSLFGLSISSSITEEDIELEKRKIYNERFLLIGENMSYKNFFDLLAQNLNVTAPQKLAKKWQAVLMSYFESFRTFLTGSYPIITSETVKSSYQNTSYSNAKIIREIGFNFTPLQHSIAQTAKIFLAFEVKNKR